MGWQEEEIAKRRKTQEQGQSKSDNEKDKIYPFWEMLICENNKLPCELRLTYHENNITTDCRLFGPYGGAFFFGNLIDIEKQSANLRIFVDHKTNALSGKLTIEEKDQFYKINASTPEFIVRNLCIKTNSIVCGLEKRSFVSFL